MTSSSSLRYHSRSKFELLLFFVQNGCNLVQGSILRRQFRILTRKPIGIPFAAEKGYFLQKKAGNFAQGLCDKSIAMATP